MDILNFIANNFDNIVALAVILLAIISSVIALKYPLLRDQLIQLITKAEIDYPIDGSGELKKSQVLLELYNLLPSWMKTFVTRGMLSWIIEKSLILAKEIWKKNPIIEQYITQKKQIK